MQPVVVSAEPVGLVSGEPFPDTLICFCRTKYYWFRICFPESGKVFVPIFKST
jgi:hypothetical protein